MAEATGGSLFIDSKDIHVRLRFTCSDEPYPVFQSAFNEVISKDASVVIR